MQPQLDRLFQAWPVDRLVLFEPFQPFEPALGLSGALRGYIALDKVRLLGDKLLLGAIFLHPPLIALGPLPHIVAIIAGIDVEPAKGQFPHLVHDPIHEIAIVGHQHDRPLPVVQVPFQPFDRLQVEVVGRLVQQQQVG